MVINGIIKLQIKDIEIEMTVEELIELQFYLDRLTNRQVHYPVYPIPNQPFVDGPIIPYSSNWLKQ